LTILIPGIFLSCSSVGNRSSENQYLSETDPSQAADILKRLEADTLNVELRLRLSIIYIDQKKYESAIDQLNLILAQNKDYIPAYIYLAEAYQKKGDLAQAVHCLENAVQIDPQNSILHLHLGNLYRDTKENGKAESELREVIKLASDIEVLALAHLGLGGLYQSQAREDEARKEYGEAFKIDPQLEAVLKELEVERRFPIGDPTEYIKTHPELKDRIDRLNKIIKKKTGEKK
jgi:Tfp pilus assembly protein PilF